MHLILIHPNPTPTGGAEGICTFKLIQALADNGIRVSVVMSQLPHSALIRNNVECYPVGTDYSTGVEPRIEKIDRLCNLYPESGWQWAKEAAKKVISLCAETEVKAVYSRSMPFISHVAAFRARRFLQVPWLAHFSDPWPPDGFHFNEKHSGLRLRWHRRIVASCDAVTFPCERVARFCQENQWGHILSNKSPKIIILPHLTGEVAAGDVLHQSNVKIWSFIHCGSFYENRRPDELLDAWATLLSRHPAQRGSLKLKHIGPVCERFSDIEQLGSCSYKESLAFIGAASALILVDSAILKTSIYFPSKFTDYIGAGKPVIALTPLDGTIGDCLGSNYPLRADPWDVPAIVEALDRAFMGLDQNSIPSLMLIHSLRDRFDAKRVIQEFAASLQCLRLFATA